MKKLSLWWVCILFLSYPALAGQPGFRAPLVLGTLPGISARPAGSDQQQGACVAARGMPGRRGTERELVTKSALLLLCAMVAPAQEPPAPATIEEAALRQLRSVRRVFVDRLTGGETAA